MCSERKKTLSSPVIQRESIYNGIEEAFKEKRTLSIQRGREGVKNTFSSSTKGRQAWEVGEGGKKGGGRYYLTLPRKEKTHRLISGGRNN